MSGTGTKTRTGSGRAEKRHRSCSRDQALSFRTRNHRCTQGVALASTRKLRSHDPMSVHAYSIERITGFEGRERANGVGGGV